MPRMCGLCGRTYQLASASSDDADSRVCPHEVNASAAAAAVAQDRHDSGNASAAAAEPVESDSDVDLAIPLEIGETAVFINEPRGATVAGTLFRGYGANRFAIGVTQCPGHTKIPSKTIIAQVNQGLYKSVRVYQYNHIFHQSRHRSHKTRLAAFLFVDTESRLNIFMSKGPRGDWVKSDWQDATENASNDTDRHGELDWVQFVWGGTFAEGLGYKPKHLKMDAIDHMRGALCAYYDWGEKWGRTPWAILSPITLENAPEAFRLQIVRMVKVPVWDNDLWSARVDDESGLPEGQTTASI